MDTYEGKEREQYFETCDECGLAETWCECEEE